MSNDWLFRGIRFATSMNQRLFHHSRFASPIMKTNEKRTKLHAHNCMSNGMERMLFETWCCLFINAFRIYHGRHESALHYGFMNMVWTHYVHHATDCVTTLLLSWQQHWFYHNDIADVSWNNDDTCCLNRRCHQRDKNICLWSGWCFALDEIMMLHHDERKRTISWHLFCNIYETTAISSQLPSITDDENKWYERSCTHATACRMEWNNTRNPQSQSQDDLFHDLRIESKREREIYIKRERRHSNQMSILL